MIREPLIIAFRSENELSFDAVAFRKRRHSGAKATSMVRLETDKTRWAKTHAYRCVKTQWHRPPGDYRDMTREFLGADQRRYERVACKLEVALTILGANPYAYGPAYAVDISESGACLFGRVPIDTPVMMQLDFKMPIPPYRHLLMGKTLRCTQCEDTDLYELNICFVGLIPTVLKKMIGEAVWKDAKPA